MTVPPLRQSPPLLLWNEIVTTRIDEDELANECRYSDGTHDEVLHQRIEGHIREKSERHARQNAYKNVKGYQPEEKCTQQREVKLSVLEPQTSTINRKYKRQDDSKPDEVQDH